MKVQDENARRSSMLVVCRKISSAVWKIFSTHVIINETKSERRTLQRGVPQGSVLGPVLFSIYTIELAWILNNTM